MKVGIVTFHCVPNIGAVLQAYALCRTLNNLGFDAKLVNYRPEYIFGRRNRLGRRPWRIYQNLISNRKFDIFRKKYMPVTERIYYSPERLCSALPDADVYVCGSDQIWNLKILKGKADPVYFLDIVPDGKKRVAYAPSFGDLSGVPSELRSHICRLLKRFDSISVRENTGQKILKDLTGKNFPVVLDPTFLIKDYYDVTVKPKKAPENYIAVYYLERSEEFKKLVSYARRKIKLPVVNISPTALPEADYNYFSWGPDEWLGWMKYSSFICTNSFHGTAFSLIFRKNFLSFSHQARPGLNIRIENLLENIGLSERFVQTINDIDNNDVIDFAIDYQAVGAKLDSCVNRSITYLKSALLD